MRIEKIRELIKLVEQSNISELELRTFWGRKIRISKYIEDSRAQNNRVSFVGVKEGGDTVVELPVQREGGEARVVLEKREEPEEKLYEIKAPLVGTFYRSPKPGAPPFVEVGDHITAGQVVCLIEAMKLFNEIKSEISGTVVKVLVEDGKPVQHGQVIFLVKPD